ncbi:MAG: TetR/AcrR family transcriptional regulator [Candidatus Nanopelagicales bacterium]|nr:TetR/AcrR family transcriptional regulator [Candidatus Nanopelagicales bacterium]
MPQREDLATVVELKTASVPPSRKPSGAKVRMTGQERREQLLNVGRKLFAEKGFETVTVEEIAAKADVSKPVVYEHFGGKEGLYAVVVDREMNYLLDSITQSLMGSRSDGASARELVEQAGMALFNYIDSNPQGFSILVRDSPVTAQTGSFASLMLDIATQVEDVLAAEFKAHGINDKYAPMYSQMLVGMVAFTGQWWLDVRKPKKEEVVAHLVNLAWNGLRDLDPKPTLTKQRKT